MKKIINKPYLFFFGLIPIFIIIGFLSGDKALDINIEDVYFAISYLHFYLFSAIFFAMIGINYFSLHWADKPPKKWLTIIHISLQIISTLLIFTSNNWNWIGEKSNEGFLNMTDNSNIIIVFAFLIFLLSAFVHLINFFTSLFLKTE